MKTLSAIELLILALFGLGCFTCGFVRPQYNPNTNMFRQVVPIEDKPTIVVSADGEHWFPIYTLPPQ